jgi:phosphatidylserine/phosphatidylglycerophosphate/cardiolipin synthase-like enzyme
LSAACARVRAASSLRTRGERWGERRTLRIPIGALLCAIAVALARQPAYADSASRHVYPPTGSVEVAFTPGDAIDKLVIDVINRARHEVLVQAYTFTHRRIAQALVNAKRRGVKVSVLADLQQARTVPQNVLRDLVAARVDRAAGTPWSESALR